MLYKLLCAFSSYMYIIVYVWHFHLVYLPAPTQFLRKYLQMYTSVFPKKKLCVLLPVCYSQGNVEQIIFNFLCVVRTMETGEHVYVTFNFLCVVRTMETGEHVYVTFNFLCVVRTMETGEHVYVTFNFLCVVRTMETGEHVYVTFNFLCVVRTMETGEHVYVTFNFLCVVPKWQKDDACT